MIVTQIINFPPQIPGCDSHSLSLLDFFLSSDASICCPMGFPPFVNSDHIVSVSTDFPITPKQDASFHGMAYDHSHADWDIPFCELVQVRIDVYIPHRKYQVKPHSSPWCLAAVIVHKNHFFHLQQQNKSFESKVKFTQANNLCKSVLEVAKIAYATKTKASINSQKLGSWDFW